MKFTQDWFSNSIPNFEKCMALLPQRERFLEIGVFEGRSTVWLLQNGLEFYGHIDCIDSFNGGQEHEGIDFKEVRERFITNTQEARHENQTVRLLSTYSHIALGMLIYRDQEIFDFIYVDGSHTAYDTLSDACMAWHLLRTGGIMLFDDYLWEHNEYETNRPKLGIDAFLAAYKGQYELVIDNYQLGVRKIWNNQST